MSDEKEDEARSLYAALLDDRDGSPEYQSFLNGFRRCLMVFDPSFIPPAAMDGMAS